MDENSQRETGGHLDHGLEISKRTGRSSGTWMSILRETGGHLEHG